MCTDEELLAMPQPLKTAPELFVMAPGKGCLSKEFLLKDLESCFKNTISQTLPNTDNK